MKLLPIKISLFLSLTILALTIQATPYYDASMPVQIKVGSEELVLNGIGVREKFNIDLFSGGLYLKKSSSDANSIIKANETMVIQIQVISNLITQKRLADNIRSEFKRIAGENRILYKERMEKLIDAFSEDIKKGDLYSLIYHPSTGINVYRNGVLQTVIPGLDFKQAVYTMWFGEDPADENFKAGMLGMLKQ